MTLFCPRSAEKSISWPCSLSRRSSGSDVATEGGAALLGASYPLLPSLRNGLCKRQSQYCEIRDAINEKVFIGTIFYTPCSPKAFIITIAEGSLIKGKGRITLKYVVGLFPTAHHIFASGSFRKPCSKFPSKRRWAPILLCYTMVYYLRSTVLQKAAFEALWESPALSQTPEEAEKSRTAEEERSTRSKPIFISNMTRIVYFCIYLAGHVNILAGSHEPFAKY